MPYLYLEGGARAIADRAIRFAHEQDITEMMREFSMFKCYLDDIYQKGRIYDTEKNQESVTI